MCCWPFWFTMASIDRWVSSIHVLALFSPLCLLSVISLVWWTLEKNAWDKWWQVNILISPPFFKCEDKLHKIGASIILLRGVDPNYQQESLNGRRIRNKLELWLKNKNKCWKNGKHLRMWRTSEASLIWHGIIGGSLRILKDFRATDNLVREKC